MRFLGISIFLLVCSFGFSYSFLFSSAPSSQLSQSGYAYSKIYPIHDLPKNTIIPPAGSLSGDISFNRRRPRQPIVVYLERIGGELPVTPPEDALVISQRNARFSPSFVTFARGQTVVFENDEFEEIDHNVYFLGSEEKDLGIFSRGKNQSHVFSKAGEVSLHCSIHSLMNGKMFVAPNLHFVVIPSDQSSFKISGIPEGEWILKTYQKSKRFHNVQLPLTIEASKTTYATIEMTR